MKLAAAYAIAGVIPEERVMEEYMIPSVFDERVAPAVATAVMRVAVDDGVARLTRGHTSLDAGLPVLA